MRQQEYAKRVMEKNKVQATKPGRPKQAPPGAVEEEPEDDLMRRRQVVSIPNEWLYDSLSLSDALVIIP